MKNGINNVACAPYVCICTYVHQHITLAQNVFYVSYIMYVCNYLKLTFFPGLPTKDLLLFFPHYFFIFIFGNFSFCYL